MKRYAWLRLLAWLVLAGLGVPALALDEAPPPDCTRVPVFPNRKGWSQRVVYYDIKFGEKGKDRVPSGTISAIKKAFEEANKVFGADGPLRFRLAATDAQRQNALTAGIIIKKGQLDRSKSEAAETVPSVVGNLPETQYVTAATITYDFDNRNIYNPFAREGNLFGTYVYKVTLHEIGHTFNLKDYPDSMRYANTCTQQTPGLSVMNDGCGMHDSQNNMPRTFTPCDRQRIELGPIGVSCCTGGGGGPGGGGPVGGGPPSCRPFLPDDQDCLAICSGQLDYEHDDTCGNAWGDWCLYLYPGSFPEGRVECETSGRILLASDLELVFQPSVDDSVSLQAFDGHFVSAQNGGWGAVTATATGVGSFETFTLQDLNGGPLRDGDPVAFRTRAGAYLQARDGGGSGMTAMGASPGVGETFTVVSLSAPGQVVGSGDTIALRSSGGYYVVAEGAGGGDVNCNRTSVGPWEQFRLFSASIPAPPLPPLPPPPPTPSPTPIPSPCAGCNNISLQAINGQYVVAAGGGGGEVLANSNGVGPWETFRLVDVGGGNVALQASNGQYVVAEGGGGGEVLANRNGVSVWETFRLIDLGAGDVALQASNGQYVVAEGGGGQALRADRNSVGPWERFRLSTGSGTPPAPPPPTPGGGSDTLASGAVLYPEQSVSSADGRFRFKYQADGNLVLYDQNGTPLWHTHTYGTSAGFVAMQGDGNLVLYDGNGTPLWASGTGGHPGAFLKVQTDGNVVIYDTNGTPLWCTWWYPS